jgi:uncharacterized protein YggE
MERLIKVTGRGKLSLTPDTVRLRIDLVDQDREYDRAIRSSTQHSQELRDAFTAFGFERSDLKTLSFHVDTEYESYQDRKDNSWKQRFLGYKAYHTLKIEFPTERESIGRILSMLTGLSGKPEFHVEYTVKDTEKAKDELLKAAVSDSRHKAEILAEAAGTDLGSIMTIDYSWGVIDFVTRPMNRLAEPAMAYGAAMEDSYEMDIEPENIEVEDTVTVIWELL